MASPPACLHPGRRRARVRLLRRATTTRGRGCGGHRGDLRIGQRGDLRHLRELSGRERNCLEQCARGRHGAHGVAGDRAGDPDLPNLRRRQPPRRRRIQLEGAVVRVLPQRLRLSHPGQHDSRLDLGAGGGWPRFRRSSTTSSSGCCACFFSIWVSSRPAGCRSCAARGAKGRGSLSPHLLVLAVLLAWSLGLSEGDALLLTILGASASYIAVPAAMRLALPEANPSSYLSMSLAITFPFNLLAGIPLYHLLVRSLGMI